MAEKRGAQGGLSAAERKARSRAMVLGGITGHLDVAQEALQLLRHLVDEPRAGAAMDTIELHLVQARGILARTRGV